MPEGDSSLPIDICGAIEQEYISRASDNGFAEGDRMGIFIVDYDNGKPGIPSLNGNRASNAVFTLSDGKWAPSKPVYWKDKNTHVDIYGYYPFDNSMLTFSDLDFTVEADQSIPAADGEMSGYEKSDFLWAKQTDVAPTDRTIMLDYSHRMAGVKVTLAKGEGFQGDEWEKLPKVVGVDNTCRKASIDLSDGSVTAIGNKDRSILAAPQTDDGVYRAVVVPQTIDAGVSAVSVTIDGNTYKYTPSEPVKYPQGKITAYTLKVDKKEGGQFTVTLTSKSIEKWENDASSHHFEAAAYTVIDCPKEGHLGECLEATGKDVSGILNLKITGRLNGDDFAYIREHIPNLAAINLLETVPVETNWYHTNGYYYNGYLKKTYYEQVLPTKALYEMKSLAHVILPKNLIVLGASSMSGIGLAYNTTLVIPQTVTILESGCLRDISKGNIVMPDNLIYIGYSAMCNNSCHWEYNLGNSVKCIGDWAFTSSDNCTGCFKLPEKLEHLGYAAFRGFGHNLTGEIRIPETLTEILTTAFSGMGFAKDVNLILHDGVTEIGSCAFGGLTFNNTIIWPANLKLIGASAFNECTFNGGFSAFPPNIQIDNGAFGMCKKMPKYIELPDELSKVSHSLFSYTDVNEVALPDNLETIGEWAFNSSQLESITIGKFVDNIGMEAFAGCKNLTSIVCVAPEPPILGENVFEFVDYDHLILEVPEGSVEKYRNADGWSKIKYITVHHELSLSKGEIACLGGGARHSLLVRSESGWTVTECPSWCKLSKSSGDTRAIEIEVEVAAASSAREGVIKFKLNDADYTAELHVKQLTSEYAEDKEIMLQQASAPFTPIPIFVVGDGFDAYDIANGTYMNKIKEQIDHFFAIEPYNTYRNYFSVSTAVSVSPQKGIGNVEQLKDTRFGTVLDPSVVIRCDYDKLMDYVLSVSSTIDRSNIDKALIMVVANDESVSGNVKIEDGGPTIALTTLSGAPYPYDSRGLVQHFAGGIGFGRLAPEYVEHFDFIQACTCPACNVIKEYNRGVAKGWYRNVALTGSLSMVPWSHLIFDPRYSDIVDVFEGADRHSRGAYRSEAESCMSTFIPYFNTVSRELIVRRIMALSGDTFDFEKFVAKDSRAGKP